MAFAPDGTIYMTVSGAAGRSKADRSAQARYRVWEGRSRARDGTAPPENPFVGKPDRDLRSIRWAIAITSDRPDPSRARCSMWSSARTAATRSTSSRLAATTDGPTTATAERFLVDGQSDGTGDRQSVAHRNPGIMPLGLLFDTGDRFPAWKALMVGSIVAAGPTAPAASSASC